MQLFLDYHKLLNTRLCSYIENDYSRILISALRKLQQECEQQKERRKH